MEFTRKEKLAIFHALDAILLADGYAHKREVDLIVMVNIQFNFYPADMDEARQMDFGEIANALRSMSIEKKNVFKGLAVAMAEADGNTSSSELRIIPLFFALL